MSGIRKEVMALAPVWIACALATAAGPFVRGWGFEIIGPIAFVLGSAALGAHALGHEYAHRTLGMLLSQPVPRSRLLATKLGVLAVAVASLTAISWLGPNSVIKRFPHYADLDTGLVFLPALMGLTLAPYLALVTRGTLGGLVFTFGLPGVLLVAADLGGALLFGVTNAAEIDRFKYLVLSRTMPLVCVFAAAATWVRFRRLEVIDGSGPHLAFPTLGWPTSRAAASPSRASRWWMLAAKELRLQQMTFIVIALYLAFSASAAWLERSAADRLPLPWQQLNTLYLLLLAILVGALTSAEERHYGTLEWQLLLPMPAWQQFAVKVGVALAIATFGGLIMPIAAAQLMPVPHRAAFPAGSAVTMSVMALGLTAASIYISTVSSSGVRALVTAIPALIGAVLLLRGTMAVAGWGARAGLLPRRPLVAWMITAGAAQAVFAVIAALAAVVFLTHALANHRRQDRGANQIARQCASMGAAIAVAGVALFLLGVR